MWSMLVVQIEAFLPWESLKSRRGRFIPYPVGCDHRWVNLLHGVEFYEGSGIWQSCDKRFLLSWEVSVLCLFVRVSWLSREVCLIIFSPRINAGWESLSGFSLPADQKWWPELPCDLAKRGGGATGAFIFQYKKKKINLDFPQFDAPHIGKVRW